MFLGMGISTVGASMIWPFLMIFVSKKLDAPLTMIGSLFTISSLMGVIASLFGGPLLDRLGRKWIMVLSLCLNGVGYIFMGHASLFVHFAVLQGLTGAVNPLYRSGADAMISDLVPPNQRVEAYSLMRLSNNLGISVGPLIGGFIATSSYTLAFYCAAAGMIAYGLLMAFFGRETLPPRSPAAATDAAPRKETLGGYPAILTDGKFMSFIFLFTLVSVCAILMWTIMPVYANTTFSVPENVYKWIPATNAIMVVVFQQFITRLTRRRPPLLVLAVGSFFYAFAVGGVGLSTGFFGFWICMIVMTIGELILAPTSSTYAANLAPADKRGRYMTLFGLTWPVGAGIGPVFGGILSDTFGPSAPWYGGMIGGVLSALAFLVMSRRAQLSPALTEPSSAD